MGNACDFIIENGVLTKYVGSGEDVVVPGGVTSIGGNAFENCSRLKSITIPKGVTSIGNYAFSWCSRLKSITISNGVTSIGNYALWNCSSLAGITIPESVMSIGDGTFMWCSSLTNITIPESVTSIGKDAFGFCSSLTSIAIPEGVTSIGDNAFKISIIFKKGKDPKRVVIVDPGNLPTALQPIAALTYAEDPAEPGSEREKSHLKYMKANAAKLVEKALAHPALLNLICEKNLLTPKESDLFLAAAREEGNMEAVSLLLDYRERNLTANERGKAAEQEEILESKVTDSVKKESQITKLPSGSFDQQPEQKNSSSKDFVIVKGVLKEYRGKAKEVMIPDTVVRISGYAFYNSGISTVIIPDSVTEIGEAAFEECSEIKDVTIPGSVKRIGRHAFYHCKNLSSLVLQEGIEEIGYCAFSHCNNLKAITIPNSIKILGKKALSACARLVDVSLPESINEIEGEPFGSCKRLCDENGFLIINNRLYGYYGTDAKVSIPEGVIGIEERAMAYEFERTYKSDLRSVTLPESVVFVGKYAFGRWDSLKSVRILGSNVIINDEAFMDCESLTTFSSLGNIQSIGKKAFSGCKSLRSFSTHGEIQSIGEGAFSGCQLTVNDINISKESALVKNLMRTGLLRGSNLIDEKEVSEAVSLYEKCMLQINQLMERDRTYNDPTVKETCCNICPIKESNAAAKAFFQRIAEDYKAGRRMESYDHVYDPDTLLKLWSRTSCVEEGHIGFCFAVGILVASYMFESSYISGYYTFVRDKWEYRGDYSMKTRLCIDLSPESNDWKIYMKDGYEEREM